MTDPRDRDRLDVDVQQREDSETESETAPDEQAIPRHGDDSRDVFDAVPGRAARADDRPWLAPGAPDVGPAPTVDPRANTPEGHDVERNLTDLNDGFGRDIPTGTNHHGVGTTYDQDSRVGESDVDRVLDGRDPAKPATPPRPGGQGEKRTDFGVADGSAEKGSGQFVSSGTHAGVSPPPGVELGSRAPHWDLVSDDNLKGLMPNLFTQEKKGPSREEQIQKQKEALSGKSDGGTPVLPEYKEKQKYTDPDADPGAGGTVAPTAEEAATYVTRQGGGGDPLNPDDYTAPEIDESQQPRDRNWQVADPNPDDDGTIGIGGSGTPPVAGGGFTDGPRPDLDVTVGVAPQPAGGGQGGGGQPDGRAGVPEVISAAPAEVGAPAGAEPAPPVVDSPQLSQTDFDEQPVGAGQDAGEPGDVDLDDDGMPG